MKWTDVRNASRTVLSDPSDTLQFSFWWKHRHSIFLQRFSLWWHCAYFFFSLNGIAIGDCGLHFCFRHSSLNVSRSKTKWTKWCVRMLNFADNQCNTKYKMPKVLPFRVNYIDVGFPVFLIIYLFVFTVGNKVLLIYSIDQSMKKKICFRRLHKGA